MSLRELIGRVDSLNGEVLQELATLQRPGTVSGAMETQILLGSLEDALSIAKKAAVEAYDTYRLSILPEMVADEGMSSANVPGLGSVYLVSDAYVSVPVGDAPEFHRWLRDNGSSGIIKETVHPGTLKAFIKGMMKEGKEVPEMVKVTPFTRAQITKS